MFYVVLLRIITGTFILRFPLLGGILAIIIDYFDIQLLELLQNGDLNNYQYLDKLLDLYYLALECYVVLAWKNRLVKNAAVFLFFYRVLGTIAFELTGNGAFLVIFPNVFEPFFLFYLASTRILKKEYLTSPITVILLILILLLPKIGHEYLLHINTTHPWTENVYVKKLLH